MNQNFAKFYKFVYDFEAKSNNMLPKVAVELWKQMYQKKWKHIDKWVELFSKKYKKYVTKTLWNQFYEFCESKDDFSDFGLQNKIFDPIFDDFIQFLEEIKQ